MGYPKVCCRTVSLTWVAPAYLKGGGPEENAEKFQAVATPVFSTKEYQEFAANLEVETYFASTPTK